MYVSGEVNRPGIQEYRGGLTLVQAISDAGGFNRRARREEVLLIRPGPENEPVGTIIDVKEILRKGQISNDVPLAPLDIVYVHHKKIVNLNIFVRAVHLGQPAAVRRVDVVFPGLSGSDEQW